MEQSHTSVVVLDVSPSLWSTLSKSTTLTLRAVVDQCLSYLSSQALFRSDPNLALIVCDEVSSLYVWPPAQVALSPELPNAPTPPAVSSLRPPLLQAATSYIREMIRAFLERTVPPSLIVHPPVHPSPGVTSALGRAVCCVGKAVAAASTSGTTVLHSNPTSASARDQRILVVTPLAPPSTGTGPTGGALHRTAPQLSASFAARAVGCPIDALILTTTALDPSTGTWPLQAACELTGGVWAAVMNATAISVAVQSCIATPPGDRDRISLPRSSGGTALHLEATCSESGRAFTVGAVCSVCFAAFSREVALKIEDGERPECPKCKTPFSTEV